MVEMVTGGSPKYLGKEHCRKRSNLCKCPETEMMTDELQDRKVSVARE